MYRPQFAYKTPDGCLDVEFTYFFDGSNTPLLYQDVTSKRIDNIPLVMEQDAPFYWRGIKVALLESASGPNGTIGGITNYEVPNVNVRFQDCYQNNLSDGYVPSTHYGYPMNAVAFNNSLLTGPPFLLDPEIYCPPGGYILLFIQAGTLTAPTTSYLLNVTLFGVKRFKDCT